MFESGWVRHPRGREVCGRMRKKPLRKTLPKDLDALFDAAAATGDDAPLKAALEACQPDARAGFGQYTALMNSRCTPALARWLVERGAAVDAVDTWGKTALFGSVFARFHHQLPPRILIELGADVQHLAKDGSTPLHAAADGKNVASARLLLAHGAAVDAPTSNGLTPLEYALARMSNVDLVAMVPLAELLLQSGAAVTPRAQVAVREAAERFEFARPGFAPDHVAETAAAAAALCARFDVAPPAARVMHDGVSPITAAGATWKERHAALWQLLVGPSGPCATVQGEVVRIAGRVLDELRRNGGVNWDADYDVMVAALGDHLASQVPLSAADLARLREAQRAVRRDDLAPERLAELAVAWVERNPRPIALEKPAYRR
jgi:hypothetical protein